MRTCAEAGAANATDRAIAADTVKNFIRERIQLLPFACKRLLRQDLEISSAERLSLSGLFGGPRVMGGAAMMGAAHRGIEGGEDTTGVLAVQPDVSIVVRLELVGLVCRRRRVVLHAVVGHAVE